MDWTSPFSDAVYGVTDFFGLTDSKAPSRALSAAESGMDTANTQLDQDTQASFDTLDQAMYNRGLGQNLDRYGQQMGTAMDQTQQAGQMALGEMDSGDAGNVETYLNPKMDQMLAKTNQMMNGSAGSTLQSSAAARNAATAVSNQAGRMWDTAFDQALKDSQNNQQSIVNYGKSAAQYGNMANQNLDAQNQPALDWINLNNDRAMTRYGGNVGLAQAGTTAAGQSRAII